LSLALENCDRSVKPDDDFDRCAKGICLDNYKLRDNDTHYGSFDGPKNKSARSSS
jgi:hypothetical protein